MSVQTMTDRTAETFVDRLVADLGGTIGLLTGVSLVGDHHRPDDLCKTCHCVGSPAISSRARSASDNRPCITWTNPA